MMNRKGTNAWKNETVSVFYGINRNSLEVERVSLSRSGVLSKFGPDFQLTTHAIGGRPAKSELLVVFGLVDVVELHPSLEKGLEEPRVKALQEKAETMKREKDAKG